MLQRFIQALFVSAFGQMGRFPVQGSPVSAPEFVDQGDAEVGDGEPVGRSSGGAKPADLDVSGFVPQRLEVRGRIPWKRRG